MREHWHKRGLDDAWIDYYKVGYCHERSFGKFLSPTLTIPIWHDGKCIGLSHRLLMEDPPGGKYRPHLPGAGKPLFYADVLMPALVNNVILVEGEIKAMVTFSRMFQEDYQWNVAAILGGWSEKYAPEFEHAANVYIVLDPDAFSQSVKAARDIGAEKCRIIELPAKIDDLFNIGALDKKLLIQLIKQGRKVKR